MKSRESEKGSYSYTISVPFDTNQMREGRSCCCQQQQHVNQTHIVVSLDKISIWSILNFGLADTGNVAKGQWFVYILLHTVIIYI